MLTRHVFSDALCEVIVEHNESIFARDGTRRVLITMLRALPDAQQGRRLAWQRLCVRYGEAMARLATHCWRRSGRPSKKIFAMLGVAVPVLLSAVSDGLCRGRSVLLFNPPRQWKRHFCRSFSRQACA
ncbi:hypothetical protein ISP15_01170 [Dyella jejuensis]|uniref:Uncharacterized protein n=1 Tax=Dyella jejuensis TaxID=1432009 RepID=A0ABW8JF79_9GAMM